MASRTTIVVFAALILIPITSLSIPFVVFHGVSEKCSDEDTVMFTELLSSWSGSRGFCVEIGNGVWDSWFMPFTKQTSIACDKVKTMSELSKGYNIIGLSQGNLVGRGVIEFCTDGPPVKNLVSLAGPHAGIASIPFCGSGFVCKLVDRLVQLLIYSDFIQENLAPAGYIKIPTDLGGYRKGCKFLPELNNEVNRNPTYKKRFSSLDNLVLIMFDQDAVLVPKETSWFGYYPDGSWTTVLPAHETALHREDWIGLRALDEAGKIKYANVSGRHLEISVEDMKRHILPYLLNNGTQPQPFPPGPGPAYEPSFLHLTHLIDSSPHLRPE